MASTNAQVKASLEALVAANGKFTKDMTEGGALYSDYYWRTFWNNGIYCQNCEFFNSTTNTCDIVDGYIWNYGACRFFIIEDTHITPTVYTPSTYVATQETGFDMSSMMNILIMAIMMSVMISMFRSEKNT
jgi:hypothetical protein